MLNNWERKRLMLSYVVYTHEFWILILLIETSFYGVFNFRLYNSPKNYSLQTPWQVCTSN